MTRYSGCSMITLSKYCFRLANSSLDYPDIQLIFGSGGENAFGGLISKRNYGIQEWFANVLYRSIATNTSYQIFPQVLRPKSKGYIKLRSSNPYFHPIIVPNHFNDSADMDLLVSWLCNTLYRPAAISRAEKHHKLF